MCGGMRDERRALKPASSSAELEKVSSGCIPRECLTLRHTTQRLQGNGAANLQYIADFNISRTSSRALAGERPSWTPALGLLVTRASLPLFLAFARYACSSPRLSPHPFNVSSSLHRLNERAGPVVSLRRRRSYLSIHCFGGNEDKPGTPCSRPSDLTLDRPDQVCSLSLMYALRDNFCGELFFL